MSRYVNTVVPKAILTLLAFFVYGQSFAQPSGWQGWKEIGSTNQFSYRVNPASIDRSKVGLVKAWVLVTPVTESSRASHIRDITAWLRQRRLPTTGMGNWSYQMAFTEIDCGNGTHRTLMVMDFDASGNVLDPPKFWAYELQYLLPRSAVKKGLADVCSGAK